MRDNHIIVYGRHCALLHGEDGSDICRGEGQVLTNRRGSELTYISDTAAVFHIAIASMDLRIMWIMWNMFSSWCDCKAVLKSCRSQRVF